MRNKNERPKKRRYFMSRYHTMAPGQFYGGGKMSVCSAHEEVKDQLRDHEKRIVALEKSDAEFAIRLQNIIEKIDTELVLFGGAE